MNVSLAADRRYGHHDPELSSTERMFSWVYDCATSKATTATFSDRCRHPQTPILKRETKPQFTAMADYQMVPRLQNHLWQKLKCAPVSAEKRRLRVLGRLHGMSRAFLDAERSAFRNDLSAAIHQSAGGSAVRSGMSPRRIP